MPNGPIRKHWRGFPSDSPAPVPAVPVDGAAPAWKVSLAQPCQHLVQLDRDTQGRTRSRLAHLQARARPREGCAAAATPRGIGFSRRGRQPGRQTGRHTHAPVQARGQMQPPCCLAAGLCSASCAPGAPAGQHSPARRMCRRRPHGRGLSRPGRLAGQARAGSKPVRHTHRQARRTTPGRPGDACGRAWPVYGLAVRAGRATTSAPVRNRSR
jgi:hypothetical protein